MSFIQSNLQTDFIRYNDYVNHNDNESIPLTLKTLIWDVWIGEDIYKTMCLCCDRLYITRSLFYCGFIIAKNNGGQLTVDNLKPICYKCNSDLGSQNMHEFINKNFS